LHFGKFFVQFDLLVEMSANVFSASTPIKNQSYRAIIEGTIY
jgi:hypothetical protein